jgi:hypothetical protein
MSRTAADATHPHAARRWVWLARAILGLTIVSIVASFWLSILDPGSQASTSSS